MFEYDHTPACGRQHGSASPEYRDRMSGTSRLLARLLTRALSLATGVLGTYLIRYSRVRPPAVTVNRVTMPAPTFPRKRFVQDFTSRRRLRALK
jgi:hypothetical protein